MWNPGIFHQFQLTPKSKNKGGEGEKVHFLGMVGFPRTTLFVVTVRKSILTSTQSDLLDSGGVCFVLQRARWARWGWTNICGRAGIPKGQFRSKGTNRQHILQPHGVDLSPKHWFLRSSPVILDGAGKCHLPHHPGTCGSEPMKKSLQSQMKMSGVKPSQWGRMKCKFNWIPMIPSCIQRQSNSEDLSLSLLLTASPPSQSV